MKVKKMKKIEVKQRITVSDNMGNRDVLEFSLPKPVSTSMAVELAAMEFSRMIGILQTLGELPDDCFMKHQADILQWAEEYASSGKMDLVLFFQRKLELLKE